MSKRGRNDPCPCGSGKKYKQCCLEQDEMTRRSERDASNAALAADVEASRTAIDDIAARYRELTHANEAATLLIEAGKFEEAEAAIREHMERFPEIPDGCELMGMLSEARNEPLVAASWYRKVVAFIIEHPKVFKPKDATRLRRLIQRLDPDDATA
jgi:hypothetical protein